MDEESGKQSKKYVTAFILAGIAVFLFAWTFISQWK
ncbi:hypothetical protein EDC63_111107 [Sulfurirhabdus autotrophica]|uniref:Uncharacterized protein n=1 Tax=Sulfurirhabdus autotrophica TaxID=1706046 RepID=A0A4R3Y0J6_9PROT|nr:hypothetical protein EDC63_111107 [Sulfurirhabdus autotrophica]